MDDFIETYRVIVAGGRLFDDYDFMDEKLQVLLKEKLKTHNVIIVSGGAKGADTLGERWAEAHGVKCIRYPALWEVHGKRAGFIRNQEMADNADALVAFPVNQSNGTRDMIFRARRLGLKVKVYNC